MLIRLILKLLLGEAKRPSRNTPSPQLKSASVSKSGNYTVEKQTTETKIIRGTCHVIDGDTIVIGKQTIDRA